MTVYIAPGDLLEYHAPEPDGVVSGLPYSFSGYVVIALDDAPPGARFPATPVGVHIVAKNVGEAWAPLQRIYFDPGTSTFTPVAAGNTLVGVAAESAEAGQALGWALLDGVAR